MNGIDDRIAVIGMAVRLPGAEDVTDLSWLLTHDSTEVDEVPASRWARELFSRPDNHQGPTYRGAFLQDPFSFDHQAFGLTAQEAILLDPQQRVMLEVGARALEDSGYLSSARRLPAGVFVAARMNAYGFDHGRATPPDSEGGPAAAALWGRSQNFMAAWLSDRFDLSGPSLVVDTACSSSLTAVWLACQSLRAGACELALVGAVDLLIDPLTYLLLSRAGALSPDGRCQTFDERANGYVPGEGAVALVLKPMARAAADGDLILGAITRVGVNNDGRTMGVTTPNLEAQIELLSGVYAHVDPTTVQYVEAHGTGTAIGDPIEVQALAEVFNRHGLPRGSVALGSLKRRIGHLHSAAGLAGLAKVVLCLRDGLLPAISVASPNPRLRLDTSPFYLPARPTSWPQAPLRRAAISSFGFGGTNGHVVVEAVSEPPPAPSQRPVEVLALSADTPDGLRELIAQWTELLPTAPEVPDLCATARLARPHRPVRVAVCGRDGEALAAALRNRLLGDELNAASRDTSPRPVRVRPLAAPVPPPWLLWLNRAEPAVAEIIDRFEAATGRELATFSGPLLGVCTSVVLTVALRDLGLPESAVELPAGWEAIADFAYGRASLEEALAQVVGRATEPMPGDPRGSDVSSRLAAAHDERSVVAVLAATVAEAYESGHHIDWKAFQRDLPWRKRTLPSPQLRGPSLMLHEPLRSPEAGAGVVMDADDGPDGYRFSRVFGPGEAPIAQHSVYRKAMLPGVAWFDFLRQGARLRGETVHGLREVLFHRPMMPAGAHRVVCHVGPEGQFVVTDNESRERYVTGRLVREPGPQPRPESLRTLLETCSRVHAGSGVYRWLRRIGYQHGRYYRNLSWVASLPDGGTLARIEGGRQRALNPPDVALFPGLLDSVTIAAIDPVNPVFGAADASAFIPLSIAEVRCFGPLDEAAFVRTKVAFWNAESCRVTQVVTDAAGQVLLTFDDISSKRVPARAFVDAEPTDAPSPPLPTERATTPVRAVADEPPSTMVAGSPQTRLLAWFLHLTGTPHSEADTEFLSAGFDSVGLVELSDRISRDYGVSLYPTVFFEHSTPRAFAEFLAREAPELAASLPPATRPSPSPAAGTDTAQVGAAEPVVARPAVAEARSSAALAVGPTPTDGEISPRDVAVVGAAMRVPGASALGQVWSLLAEGKDTVGEPPPGRWHGGDGEVPRASFLDTVSEFDPAPFHISAREAPLIDPQARIVYETIWEALEDAGRLGERAKGDRTGLWIAYSHDHYHEERSRHGVASGRGLGLEAMIPNRLSYLMDWRGPSVLVNTLCSSSLVALHSALQHLRAGDIDTAVIGAVHAALSPEYFRSMRELMALSPRHRCRAFDASADGVVPGEGAVAVVLRRGSDAAQDGDQIRGLIKGAAVNHGGRTTRYSAPSPRGQYEVVAAALRDADVTPEAIGLVEAHGTGTSLGDPIELEALTRAWRHFTQRRQFCALGSLKSNLGHLEPAAGLAGLVKVLLAMEHQRIPPTLHVTRPNDHIHFEATPFYLADRPLPWPRGDRPRTAAVSAFGMGGVNAHVIVQEPPPTPSRHSLRQDSYLVKVGGAGEAVVRRLAGAYAEHLRQASDATVPDFTYTANVGRAPQRSQVVVAGADRHELVEHLQAVAAGQRPVTRLSRQPAPVAFLFTGQGSQYVRMGEQLYATEPAFRDTLDECAALLDGQLEHPLLSVIFGDDQRRLTQTEYAQAGIVSVQVGLVRLLEAWGVRPDMAVGHSVGELTAAWAAGVFTLADLMRLTSIRGRAMQAVPTGGAMAVVHADADTVHALLAQHPRVEVAAYNAPRNITLSGPADAIDALCAAVSHPTKPLTVSHAFHCAAMAPAVPVFTEAVAATVRSAPTIPVASTLTGRWHTTESITDPGGWGEAIRRPVRFAEAVSRLATAGAKVLWEIGPHPVLSALGKATLPEGDLLWLHTLRRGRNDQRQLHGAVAALHNDGGHDIAWSGLHERKGHAVAAIPSYPFQRQSFWISAASRQPAQSPTPQRDSAPYQ